GTLVVNGVGSFLLGLFMQLALGSTLISPTIRIFLTTGFCGGFTTYSTFNHETTRLFADGARTVALLNVVVTLVLCLAGGLLGMAAGRGLLALLKVAPPAG